MITNRLSKIIYALIDGAYILNRCMYNDVEKHNISNKQFNYLKSNNLILIDDGYYKYNFNNNLTDKNMSSHLHIGNLSKHGYESNHPAYYGAKCQLSFGFEDFRSIEELELALHSTKLRQKIKKREADVLYTEVRQLISEQNYDDDEDGFSLNSKLYDVYRIYNNCGISHKEKPNFNLESGELSYDNAIEVLTMLKGKYDLVKNQQDKDDDEYIQDILSWARENFIEGKNYFYTL
jgi:hypothetical protein